MALSIKHPEADRLARELAATTGESLTEAVLNALRERLQRQRYRKRNKGRRRLAEQLREISERCAALPVLDSRSGEDILGYDDRGLPR
jgi:antitoxin VapB